MAKKILIFDTTLRDGEQCPGASLTATQKLEVAKQLAKLRVDIIEAGFPIASPGDFDAVQIIAQQVEGPVIAALARSLQKDIDAAAKALRPAKQKRLHVFLATSPIHRKYKLRKAEEEIIRQAVWAVKYARKFVKDVEFSPEDASRTEPEFLYRVVESVIAAGAATVNIPDTVGYAIPEEFGALIKGIRDNVPNINKAVISVHCHNDLGLAVSNSLSAIANGAGQVECTVNGIGERAGNASVEEIVMALRVRSDLYKATTGVNTKEIYRSSRLVSSLTGLVVQPNKAVVGDNAFRHESGIHQDGVIKYRKTYEIMRSEDIGLTHNTLVLGKHSGRHAFRKRVVALGYRLSEEAYEHAFERFKDLADKKKEVFDDDLIAIIEQDQPAKEIFKLEYVHTVSGTGTMPTATIRLLKKGKPFQDAACGDGPVDACYQTINRIIGIEPELVDYSIRSVTKGQDAQGEVTVRLRHQAADVTARATSTDIIEASAKAYIGAVNRLLSTTRSKRMRPRASITP